MTPLVKMRHTFKFKSIHQVLQESEHIFRLWVFIIICIDVSKYIGVHFLVKSFGNCAVFPSHIHAPWFLQVVIYVFDIISCFC